KPCKQSLSSPERAGCHFHVPPMVVTSFLSFHIVISILVSSACRAHCNSRLSVPLFPSGLARFISSCSLPRDRWFSTTNRFQNYSTTSTSCQRGVCQTHPA